MARVGSRKSKGLFLDAVDNLTLLGMQIGGAAFALASAYLLWGIFTGSLVHSASLPVADQARVLGNIKLVCSVLGISGIILVLSAAARYYNDEITGYLLLIGGALLHWGVPIMIGSTLRGMSLGAAGESVYTTVGQFKLVGIVALVAALPFTAADLWYKICGIRRGVPNRAVTVTAKEKAKVKDQEIPKSHFHIFCWQMPFCRDYLRGFCKAYEQRKSCWRIKSGCYCDEDMILRAMKTSNTGKMAGFDQKFSEVAGKSKGMTTAEKRQRCRYCFLYVEHQKLKYQILSPLAFPATVFVMWTYLKPVKAFLSRAMEITDKLAGGMSYGHGPAQAVGNQWTNAASTSDTVLWIFLICIGLILVTYILRGLEYCIFDLQV